jgi:hypothetical protein
LDRLLYSSDFIVGQGIESTSLLSRKAAVVLEAETNEQVNPPVGHVHDVLDCLLGLVVLGVRVQV